MPKKNQGHVEIDHRFSPGLSEPLSHRMGLDERQGKQYFEADTYTCGHCTCVVILNPERTRLRETCRKCDRWICDRCGAVMKASGGECRNFDAFMDQLQEAAAQANGSALLNDLVRNRNG